VSEYLIRSLQKRVGIHGRATDDGTFWMEVAIGDYKGMDLLHLFWKPVVVLCRLQQTLL